MHKQALAEAKRARLRAEARRIEAAAALTDLRSAGEAGPGSGLALVQDEMAELRQRLALQRAKVRPQGGKLLLTGILKAAQHQMCRDCCYSHRAGHEHPLSA